MRSSVDHSRGSPRRCPPAAGLVFGTYVVRSERFARKVGNVATRSVTGAASKFHRDAPEHLTDTLLEWRNSAKLLIAERWWQMWLAHASVTAMNVAMLTAALRFAGADSGELTLAEILLSHALVQLVTLIPITNGNIGIAEIAYIAFLAACTTGFDAITGAVAAGVIVFGIFNWLLVIPVGFISTAVWWSRWKRKLGYDPFTILRERRR